MNAGTFAPDIDHFGWTRRTGGRTKRSLTTRPFARSGPTLVRGIGPRGRRVFEKTEPWHTVARSSSPTQRPDTAQTQAQTQFWNLVQPCAACVMFLWKTGQPCALETQFIFSKIFREKCSKCGSYIASAPPAKTGPNPNRGPCRLTNRD